MITRMDHDIGRIGALLKELNLDDKTIVFFSSDNGSTAEGGHEPRFFGSNAPLRGKKRDLYEGGIRVPMIARWPGHIKAGSTSDQVWAFWDLLPTLVELAGAQTPPNLDGISMAPALLGKPQKQHAYLYWEFHEGPRSKQAVRFEDWKAVRYGGSGEPIELYDLKTDRAEQRNLAASHSELVTKANDLFRAARTDSPQWPLKNGKQPK